MFLAITSSHSVQQSKTPPSTGDRRERLSLSGVVLARKCCLRQCSTSRAKPFLSYNPCETGITICKGILTHLPLACYPWRVGHEGSANPIIRYSPPTTERHHRIRVG